MTLKTGLVDRRNHPGEGTHPGQVDEPVGVTQPSQDAGGEDGGHSGSGDDDPGRVGLGIELSDARLEAGEFLVEVADQAHLRRQVPGQLLEVQAAVFP